MTPAAAAHRKQAEKKKKKKPGQTNWFCESVRRTGAAESAREWSAPRCGLGIVVKSEQRGVRVGVWAELM